MALPIIETPTFEIDLPHTKGKEKFRPFLVKEEKLLIMANESGEEQDMIRATQQIVTNCSFGKIDGEKLPLFALQKIFLDLRAQSVASTIELTLKCGSCETPHNHTIDLKDLEISENPEHSKKIKISDDIFVDMEYPSAFEVQELFKSTSTDEMYKIMSKCLHVVYQGDEIFNAYESSDQEKQDWLESLSLEQFEKFRKFFETMPVLAHEINFNCGKCGRENYIDFNGYQNFFV